MRHKNTVAIVLYLLYEQHPMTSLTEEHYDKKNALKSVFQSFTKQLKLWSFFAIVPHPRKPVDVWHTVMNRDAQLEPSHLHNTERFGFAEIKWGRSLKDATEELKPSNSL